MVMLVALPRLLTKPHPTTHPIIRQGTPQWVWLHFQRPVHPTTLQLMFQGGFVGKEMDVSITLPAPPPSSSAEAGASKPSKVSTVVATFSPEDDNSLQAFDLSTALADRGAVRDLRLTFRGSTDFYGRVTLYQLVVLGREEGKGGWRKIR